MHIGLGEWGFRELPFEDHCKIAGKFGFTYLELGIGGDFPGRLPAHMTASELRKVQECAADYGLHTPFICLENDFTLANPAILRKMVSQTLEEIKICKSLGATHVRLFAGFTPASELTDDMWGRMIQAFLEVDQLCSNLGITISIETHGKLIPKSEGFQHIHTASTEWTCLQRLLRDLPEHIGFNFDPGNLKPFRSPSLVKYARLLGERINYCHLKDWKSIDDAWVACGIGDDDIDWKSLLDQIQFDGVYLIEYEPVDDVEDGIARCLDHLRKLYPNLSMGV